MISLHIRDCHHPFINSNVVSTAFRMESRPTSKSITEVLLFSAIPGTNYTNAVENRAWEKILCANTELGGGATSEKQAREQWRSEARNEGQRLWGAAFLIWPQIHSLVVWLHRPPPERLYKSIASWNSLWGENGEKKINSSVASSSLLLCLITKSIPWNNSASFPCCITWPPGRIR